MGNQNRCTSKRCNKNRGGERRRGVSELDNARQISRDKKSMIHRQIYPVYERERDQYKVDILFIENETENNEKVLLETFQLGNGMYSVELPSLISDVLDLPVDEMKTVISENFDIEFDNICFTIQADEKRRGLIAIKGIKINNSDLTSLVVRTYNPATWFTGRTLTQMRGVKYYNGDLTDNYFASKDNLGNIVVSTNMLSGILDYRLASAKIESYKCANIAGKNRNQIVEDFIATLTNPDIMSRFEQEERELALLLYGEGSKRRDFAQNINKFLSLRAKLEECRQRVREKELGIVQQGELVDGTGINVDEKHYVFSLFYGKKPIKKGD